MAAIHRSGFIQVVWICQLAELQVHYLSTRKKQPPRSGKTGTKPSSWLRWKSAFVPLPIPNLSTASINIAIWPATATHRSSPLRLACWRAAPVPWRGEGNGHVLSHGLGLRTTDSCRPCLQLLHNLSTYMLPSRGKSNKTKQRAGWQEEKIARYNGNRPMILDKVRQ